jgi:hypothetical protein
MTLGHLDSNIVRLDDHRLRATLARLANRADVLSPLCDQGIGAAERRVEMQTNPGRVIEAQTVILEQLFTTVFGDLVNSGEVQAEVAQATLNFLADRIERKDYELGFRKDGPDPDTLRQYFRQFRAAAAELGRDKDAGREVRHESDPLSDLARLFETGDKRAGSA